MKHIALHRTLAGLCMNVILMVSLQVWVCHAADIIDTTPVTQNFDSMGANTANALPADWRMHQSGAPSWASGTRNLTQQASSGSPNTGGSYNWGSTTTERCPGVMTSGSYSSPSSLMGEFTNKNSSAITALTVSYQCERYRQNTANASVQFFYSLNGSTWTAVTAGDVSTSELPTGSSVYGFNPPNLTVTKSGINITGLNVAQNQVIYLRWNLNTTGSNSQGIGIDDVTVTATFSSGAPGPNVTITNPASAVLNVPSAVSSYALAGTNANIAGNLTVSNNTTLLTSTLAPSGNAWSYNVASLSMGSNVIVVTGTNTAGTRATASVLIIRNVLPPQNLTATALDASEIALAWVRMRKTTTCSSCGTPRPSPARPAARTPSATPSRAAAPSSTPAASPRMTTQG